MAKQFTEEDDELLSELGVEVETQKAGSRTPREERIIAGFEEIQRFVEQHGRAPQHGEGRDIFERLYAVRLDQIREQEECRSLVADLDHQNLLAGDSPAQDKKVDELDDDALLAELGVDAVAPALTELRHVRSSAEKKAAEEIANREPCKDFDQFKPLFEKVSRELEAGTRESRVIRKDAGFLKAAIKTGDYFILSGQTLLVASVGEAIKAPNGEADARLRVIYSNGTESNLLLRSLQRAIYKDETSRMISEPNAGPLFSDEAQDDDLASGTIYVLRSRSEHPIIVQNRTVLHKVGVTSGSVERRIANAKVDPTYLLADVEVVATYELFNINRTRLENLLHRVLAPARIDFEILDRFGNPVKPREWFLVPLPVIDQIVERIRDQSITEFVYDPKTASLV